MRTETTGHAAMREGLSALVDGELGDAHVTDACSHWRVDAEARASWHAYQLIGDALRSEDLCSAPGHDADFLAALRSRLADEPVVLAPQAAVSAPVIAAAGVAVGGRRGWRMPAAIAAGFVAVVVVATRVSAPAPGATTPDAPALARSESVAPRVVTARESVPLAASAAPDARGLVANGQLIRDVRLDRYLSAHKQFAGSSALGVPSGFLRNATADAADR